MDERDMRIVVVGGGKMGEAIVSGWLASDVPPADGIRPSQIIVVNPGDEKRAHLENAYGVTSVADVADVERAMGPGCADLVVLAVKPQVMMGVLDDLSTLGVFGAADAPSAPLFVSIAAGLTTESIQERLPEGARLVRVMPNMPLMIGAGASGVCASATATEQDVRFVADLFSCLGRAVVVDENDMDAVCAVSGSGPAYVAAMIESLRDGGVAQGLDADLAETLALQTVLGTAQLISETDLSPQAAREAVCSPGGTTLAALDAMYAAGFSEVFDSGVAAAVRRSKELAQCS